MSIISRIKGSIRYLISGEPRIEQLITKLPATSVIPQLAEYINKKLSEENAELKAELLKLKAKEEERQLEEKRKLEEIDKTGKEA